MIHSSSNSVGHERAGRMLSERLHVGQGQERTDCRERPPRVTHERGRYRVAPCRYPAGQQGAAS